MAVLFMEDFGHGDMTVARSRGWNYGGTSATQYIDISNSKRHIDFDGRGAAYMLRLQSNTSGDMVEYSPIVAGTPRRLNCAIAVVRAAVDAGEYFLIRFRKSGSSQFEIRIFDDYIVRLYRGSTLVATGSTVLVDGNVYWISIDLLADNSGSCTVYLNGSSEVTFTGDTQQHTAAGWDQFGFGLTGIIGLLNSWKMYACDIIVTDVSTAILAEHSLLSTSVNGDDAVQFTRSSGTANYETVDEIPYSTTDYNESVVAGDQDTLETSPQPYAAASYTAAQIAVYAGRDGALTGVQTVFKSGVTTDTSSTATLAGVGQYSEVVPKIWETDPNTGTAWTESGLNSAKIGYKSV